MAKQRIALQWEVKDDERGQHWVRRRHMHIVRRPMRKGVS